MKKNEKTAQKEIKKVDVHNRDLMISLGIHPNYAIPRDESVWTKTNQEKKLLKSFRCKHKEDMHFHYSPIKIIPVYSKLIIQLKKNHTFPNCIYSMKCWQHEIGQILSMYYQVTKSNKIENLVVSYKYNGKEYKPNERPFWR